MFSRLATATQRWHCSGVPSAVVIATPSILRRAAMNQTLPLSRIARRSFSLPASPAAAATVSAASAEPYRARRALLYMPGSSPKMLTKSSSLAVDSVCMDLEDAVAANRKVDARTNIITALNTLTLQPNTEWLVRINPVGSGFESEDVTSIVVGTTKTSGARGRLPDGFVIPKIESAAHVRWCSQHIPRINPFTGRVIPFILLIESARAILNLKEICSADPDRTRALIFGADDYAADVGAVRTVAGNEIQFARNQVLVHAKAYGLQSIDAVQINFTDTELLRRESEDGFGLGYTGKQIIHPNQIDTVQRAFSPDPKQLQWAKRVVDAANAHAKAGTGAFTLDNKMIDMPTIKNAEKLLALGRTCGLI